MKRIAINGLGRIGRAALKILTSHPDIEVVAVNDIAPVDDLVYLLRYDSIHGRFGHPVDVVNGNIVIDSREIHFSNESNPSDLPWQKHNIDIVIESTGAFTHTEGAYRHIQAGARTVILSGPSKDNDIPTVVHGVNTKDGNAEIFSCASCTTNNVSPLIEILGRTIGVKKAILNTIHANTSSNHVVDSPSRKNQRMGRSGLNNLIPTTTGAAKATIRALPEYENKFDGIAIRVPVPVGSISDVTIVTDRPTSVDEINTILTEAANSDRYNRVIAVSTDPLVSSDIIKSPYAAIVDLPMTRVVDGDLVKILAWYDNEWGFTHQLIRQIESI